MENTSIQEDKALRLLLRQLKDIQAQADKIQTGENSDEAIEAFAKYSVELKNYISANVQSQEVRSFLADLPEIDYRRMEIKFWQYLILPSWWIAWYNDYHARNRAIQEINMVRGKYATLELLVRGLAN
jgi:hypothetical protein